MTRPGFIIRPAAPDDVPALGRFGTRTFRQTFGPANRLEDVEAYVADTYDPARMHDEVRHPAYGTLGVESEGEVVGFAQLKAGPPSPPVTGPAPVELLRFYVDAAWHGRGLAQQLMAEACALAARRGARTLWLGVWEHNARAIAFYRKSGFLDVGSQAFLLGSDRQTDRVMSRALQGPDGRADVVPFRPEHTPAFYLLNRAWLDGNGLFESADEAYLTDPQGTIIDRGGAAFVAVVGDAVVGTAAIMPRGPGEVELTKLTVAPDRRGSGLGRRLAEACLEGAHTTGARRVVLISHSKLRAALGLYESLGFTRRPMLPDHAQALADTCMSLELDA